MRPVASMLLSVVGFVFFARLGCAGRPPDEFERTPSQSLEAPDEGPLQLLRMHVADEAPPAESGFLLIEDNGDALLWRLALVDSAVKSLDIQYYLWAGDATGDLLTRRVVEAAERGVRVRVIVDDFLVTEDGSDSAVLARHPRIEVRFYNPWARRGPGMVGRGIEWISRDELNHRMHNKLLVADGTAAIVGGRNVADEYFGVNPRVNFRDLDVLAVGPIVAELGEAFDEYWNDEWAYPAEAIERPPEREDFETVRAKLVPTPAERERLAGFPLERRDWRAFLEESAARLSYGASVAVSDDPRTLRDPNAIPEQVFESLGDLTAQIESELTVVSAYFVPDEPLLEYFGELHEQGVRVRVLTNSLGSTNHPIVNSQYKRYRGALLDVGVELYEMRDDREDREAVDTPPVRADWHVLHAKAVLVDRSRMYIGGLNISPRGILFNSENGLLISDDEFVAKIAELIDRDLSPPNAWHVTRDASGRLQWRSKLGTRQRQPARSTSQRLQDWLFGFFSLEDQI
jgi:putative cardiolipin synthase